MYLSLDLHVVRFEVCLNCGVGIVVNATQLLMGRILYYADPIWTMGIYSYLLKYYDLVA